MLLEEIENRLHAVRIPVGHGLDRRGTGGEIRDQEVIGVKLGHGLAVIDVLFLPSFLILAPVWTVSKDDLTGPCNYPIKYTKLGLTSTRMFQP